jgi:hypothetical protein
MSKTGPFEELLGDANAVATYLRRTNRQHDGALFTALAEFEKTARHNWTDRETVNLHLALNNAISLIAPTTLRDLVIDGWDPLRRKTGLRYWTEAVVKNIFLSISTCLMVAAAWYTLQYNVGVSIVDQLNSISARNIEQQLREDLWHLTSQSDKINSIVQKPFYGESDRAYIDAIDKLRHEGTELISTATYAGDFVDLSSLPFDVIQHRLIAPRLAPDTSSLPPYGQVCDIVGQSSAPAFMLVDLKSPQAIPPPDVTLESLFKNYRAYVSRAACVMGIGTDPFNFPDLAKLLVDSKSRINLLALWVLPSIYGALGAAVYYMRRFVDPTVPNPDLVRVLYRIALGSFSGIILAWFWSPTTKVSMDSSGVALNLFGIAFLFGFSVEFFFVFLERMVFLGTSWIRRIGTSSEKPG